MSDNMKKLLVVIALLVALMVWNTHSGKAQSARAVAAGFEYATVKWDGPDRLYYNLPDKFEWVHLATLGVEIPREAQEEEWCLAWAANKMAKDGWEPINLNSRRILFRRPK